MSSGTIFWLFFVFCYSLTFSSTLPQSSHQLPLQFLFLQFNSISLKPSLAVSYLLVFNLSSFDSIFNFCSSPIFFVGSLAALHLFALCSCPVPFLSPHLLAPAVSCILFVYRSLPHQTFYPVFNFLSHFSSYPVFLFLPFS